MLKKAAIVTGVSRLKGIGRAICIALAQKGFDICFTYWSAYDKTMPWSIKEEEPELIQKEITALGVRCEKIELDLAREDAVPTLLNYATKQLGTIHVLINNATYSTQTTVDNFSGAELDRHYAVNVKAATLLSIAFIRQFQQEKGGRIINLSSGQALGAMSDEIAYAMTKGAMDTLTYTLAPKIAARGITINSVNPGPTDTGWMDADLEAELLPRFPMKRIGKPADVARLIGFLVSEEAEWVTGQIIHSEGGFIR